MLIAMEIIMDKQSLSNHLVALKNKHHDLDKRIEVLYAEKAQEQHIIPLKKEKLILKEEIVKIEEELK